MTVSKLQHFGLVLVIALVALGCHRQQRMNGEERYSTRIGDRILLHPGDVSFQMPAAWLQWDEEFHNNFHLSTKELRAVKDGSGEWDIEYAQVVNAALPFENCAAHVGGEGWGRDGSSFGDLQLRAYLLDADSHTILKNIEERARIAAERVGKNHASVGSSEEREWRRVLVDYYLWYGDYGGTATVQFYIRPDGNRTLVLAFMVANGGQGEAEMQPILNSVSDSKTKAAHF